MAEPVLDEDKAMAFIGRVVADCAAALSAPLVVLGDRLGLYQAMAFAGPLTAAEVAARADASERYVREWLLNQTASGYVEYDPTTARYTLPDEHAVALTDDASPLYVGGMFHIVQSITKAEPRIEQSFHTGDGMLWGEHDAELFPATERLFRPGYLANLVSSWIPALNGVAAKLEAGARVADVGCGHGASTLVLAHAFPKATLTGFDNHAPSIEVARAAAEREGVADRVTFTVGSAQDYPGAGYDLVAFFDCLHDMGDPVGALRRTARTLAPDGTVLIVEPMAPDHVEESVNPVSRFYSAGSTLLCMPNALASGSLALGNQVPEPMLRALAEEAGFTSFRRVAETPFNRVFEARR
ncbi:MAG: class I SAM-dependent methyltransferase [Ktedonobacterales bacterium]